MIQNFCYIAISETLQTIFNSDCKFNKFQNNSIGPGTSSKIQSPAKSETPSSAKKASHHHTPKSKVQENFRNALLIGSYFTFYFVLLLTNKFSR